MKLASGSTLISGGQLIDGTGAQPIQDAALLIENGRIAYAGPATGVQGALPDVRRIDALGGTILPGLVEAHFHPTYDEMHTVVATAHNHNLKVTGHCRATEGIKNALRAGYDAIEHGTFMDDEALDPLLNYVGFTPLETLKCATKTGAEILGRGHELGTLEVGKLADVLVVEGDVAADISLLERRDRFLAVIQGGIVKAGRLA